MNIFNRDFGLHQGRIQVPNAPEGKFVYELGHSALQDATVRVGDYHEVKQTFVLTAGTKFVLASIVIATPEILPIGAAWEVSARLNGSKMVSRKLRPSKRRLVLEDWHISMFSSVAGPATNSLAFRLELV